MKQCPASYLLPNRDSLGLVHYSDNRVICQLQAGHDGQHKWPTPQDWVEELAAAGTQYDGHVTNGSLAAQIGVIEKLLKSFHSPEQGCNGL